MRRTLFLILLSAFFTANVLAQTTAFTYQGSLQSSGSPANGNYDLEFKLFDLVSGGAQQGSTLQRLNVAVANGIFTVTLDFGAPVLPGADRFLDIAVRTSGGGAFTPLTPRQQVNSTPYAVRSLNAATADSVAAAGIPAGSGNYIQNTTSPQGSSNFNISGTGTVGGILTANVVNSATEFQIVGVRVLAGDVNTNNFFGGVGAGVSNTTGNQNTFVGRATGPGNTVGDNNSFLGAAAGNGNSTGSNNTAVGAFAGLSNHTGSKNTFLGANSNGVDGLTNATAIGAQARVTVDNSLILGSINGVNGATADTNVGIGTTAPVSPLHLNGNSTNFGITFTNQANSQFLRGYRLAFDNDRLSFQKVDDNGGGAVRNDMVINSSGGNVGIGTATPNSFYKLHVEGNGFFNGTLAANAGSFSSVQSSGNISTNGNITLGGNAASVTLPSNGTVVIGAITSLGGVTSTLANAIFNGSVGIGTGSNILARFHLSNGLLRLDQLGTVGAAPLCRNANNEISNCSSSLRYKTNVGEFFDGLSFVNKLRPLSFDWKDGGMKDVGFGAEDIEKIDPRFVTYNDKGEVEGVKYDRMSVAFVNAFKEQQAQIETLQIVNSQQQTHIEKQQRQIDELKNILCSITTDAEICKTKEK